MIIRWKNNLLFLYIGFLLLSTLNIHAQNISSINTIMSEMGKLEDKRDPKCYATATRLENFMYGSPLSDEARFTKNNLQKEWALKIWELASISAGLKKSKQISSEDIKKAYEGIFSYEKDKKDKWILTFSNGLQSSINNKDYKQYSSVAYALRALMAVQQEQLFNPNSTLLPLSSNAVKSLKSAIELYTLSVLKKADERARISNIYSIDKKEIESVWNMFLPSKKTQQKKNKIAKPSTLSDLKLLNALIKQKLSSYQAYNQINNHLFIRNLQVYFAKLSWPKDPKEAKLFKNTFTEVMISFSNDLYKGAEQLAISRGNTHITEKDVFDFVQTFIPHSINIYEDAIFFPNLPKKQQVVIESYDMDAFRDSGLHWTYLKYAIHEPAFKAYLEPDPFASELIVENIAQFGVLALRLTGEYGKQQGEKRLSLDQFKTALNQLQNKIDEHVKVVSEGKDKKTTALSSAKDTETSNLNENYFSDVTKKLNIDFMHRSSDWLNRQLRSYLPEDDKRYVSITIPPAFGGGGVASEDFNNDGYPDIFILGGLGNKLYKNIQGKFFEDVTVKAKLNWTDKSNKNPGEPRQPLIADINNDGYRDIIITYANGLHRVYKNNGDETFEDLSLKANLGGINMVAGPAALLDINNDGLLDLYISYFGDYIRGVLPTLKRHNTNGRANQLFLNKGDFTFENITKGSGVDNTGWAQALTHTDFNKDGKQDIILGNDFGVNSYYQNQGDGTFIDLSLKLGVDKASYTMSLGLADLNDDFIPDVYVSNIVTMNKDEKYVLPSNNTTMKFNPDKLSTMRVIEANDLFLSQKDENNSLSKYSQSNLVGRGYSSTGWSWDSDFFDYDNDGDDDLYVTNGMNEFNLYSSENPYYADPNTLEKKNVYIPVSPKERNVFFVNEKGMLQNHSQKSGMNILSNSRSASYLDYDNDGDLDVILNNYHQEAYFFENKTNTLKNNWLKVELIGDAKAGINPDAIGAQLLFTTPSNRHIWRQVSSTTGYMSVHPKEQHIGLGKEKSVNLTVIWPNGQKEQYSNIAANQRVLISYGKKEVKIRKTQNIN